MGKPFMEKKKKKKKAFGPPEQQTRAGPGLPGSTTTRQEGARRCELSGIAGLLVAARIDIFIK